MPPEDIEPLSPAEINKLTPDQNSKTSRIEPVFGALSEQGGGWVRDLVAMSRGIQAALPVEDAFDIEKCDFRKERVISASPSRLLWMLEHAKELVPSDGRKWRELAHRLEKDPAETRHAITALRKAVNDGMPTPPISPRLRLEAGTHADCMIVCKDVIVWVEGKRNDWLSPWTSWDVHRDQLARNVEAAWIEAKQQKKSHYFVLIAHEYGRLKYHEQALLDGYRSARWIGGWPHLSAEQRLEFGSRIGTVRWHEIVKRWTLSGPLLVDVDETN